MDTTRTGEQQKVFNSINTPTTLNGVDVISNPQSFQTPKIDPNATNNALTAAITGLAPALSSAQKADTKAEQANTQGVNDIVNLQTLLMGRTEDTQKAEDAVGLPTLNKELSDLKSKQSFQLAEYINKIQKQEVNATGAFGDAVSNNEAMITRQHGIDALLTSSLIQAKEGNISAAQATVDRAITAKYQPILDRIDVQKTIIEQNKENLSRADKKLADLRLEKLNLESKKLEKDMADESSVQQMIIEASAMQAPQSVIKAANDIMSKGGTPVQVAQALGRWTGAGAKAELLREQIKTEKAQRAKIQGDTTSAIDLSKPLPLNPVQTQALKSAEELLKSFDSFGIAGAPVGFTTILGTLPGTRARDFSVNFDNLKSLLSLDNVKLLKGQGAVSDAERQLLADASTKLNRGQSPAEFKKTLSEIVTTFKKATPEYQYVDDISGAINSSSNSALSADDYANSLLLTK